MWYWRRIQKIVWTDRVGTEIVLYRVRKQRNILRTVKIKLTELVIYYAETAF